MIKKLIVSAAAAALLAGSASALTLVTVEAAGAVNSTIAPAQSAIEDFDAQPTGGSVVPVNTTFASIGVGSTFTSTQILAADQYTGAAGVGNGVAVRATGDLDIVFTGRTLSYFGVWASALDGANTVSFYKQGGLVDSINLTAYALSNAYLGNPSGPFAGQNGTEKYAFFNFTVIGGYDRAVLSQNGGGGFELDNITIGVPEAPTWAMLITGFGLIGAAMRRRAVATA